MDFSLTILGSNSAMPAYGRFTTAQALKIKESIYLIDAGEGVQMQLSKYNIKRSKVKAVFISHLHGDHILGLPGLITSFSLLNRIETLDIYGPPGLEEFVSIFIRISYSHISFPINFITIDQASSGTIYEDSSCEVTAFPVDHRIACSGFLFKEKASALRLRPDMIAKYHLSIEMIKKAKKGLIVISDEFGPLEPDELCFPLAKLRSYAYCADTAYTESFIQIVSGASLMYHEATYLDELKQKAQERGHSTAVEAGLIAQKAGVGKLIIGHYSSRYKKLDPLLEEARSEFDNSHLAIEGEVHEIRA